MEKIEEKKLDRENKEESISQIDRKQRIVSEIDRIQSIVSQIERIQRIGTQIERMQRIVSEIDSKLKRDDIEDGKLDRENIEDSSEIDRIQRIVSQIKILIKYSIYLLKCFLLSLFISLSFIITRIVSQTERGRRIQLSKSPLNYRQSICLIGVPTSSGGGSIYLSPNLQQGGGG